MANRVIELDNKEYTLYSTFAIRGTSYQDDDGYWRIDNIHKLVKGEELTLEADPSEYDINAIKIFSQNGSLGYIPRNQTFKFRELDERTEYACLYDGNQRVAVYINTDNIKPRLDRFKIFVIPLIVIAVLYWLFSS